MGWLGTHVCLAYFKVDRIDHHKNWGQIDLKLYLPQ